jgi:hypothetical protein
VRPIAGLAAVARLALDAFEGPCAGNSVRRACLGVTGRVAPDATAVAAAAIQPFPVRSNDITMSRAEVAKDVFDIRPGRIWREEAALPTDTGCQAASRYPRGTASMDALSSCTSCICPGDKLHTPCHPDTSGQRHCPNNNTPSTNPAPQTILVAIRRSSFRRILTSRTQNLSILFLAGLLPSSPPLLSSRRCTHIMNKVAQMSLDTRKPKSRQQPSSTDRAPRPISPAHAHESPSGRMQSPPSVVRFTERQGYPLSGIRNFPT